MPQVYQSSDINAPLMINEIAQLSLLGVLSMGEVKGSIALDKVQALDTDKWQPTREVLLIAMEREITGGHVEHVKETVKLTDSGKKRYAWMLKRPLPQESRSQAVFLALKACFVETAPQEVRSDVVQELMCHYNCRLSGLQNNCEDCPLGSQRQQMKNEHHMRQIEKELEWLNIIMI